MPVRRPLADNRNSSEFLDVDRDMRGPLYFPAAISFVLSQAHVMRRRW